ncbi:MAG TPA: hypothetical protein VMR97_03520 [Acidimicrobiales bacterium]|nr:hypothetical protein [Acidimicrobiales bacterium]
MVPLLDLVEFVIGALVSLVCSWLLVSRLERVGARLGFSEALLGVVAALAADAPEITSAVTALGHHQHEVGPGVVLGSNVFNLAALLGLGAVVAGRVLLHRRVVVLGGSVALWVAAVAVLAVATPLAAAAALALVLAVTVPYLVLLATRGRGAERFGLPRSWARWVGAAVAEEEQELYPAIHPPKAAPSDEIIAGLALVAVVLASVVMERAGSALGRRYDVPGIVLGALVLAAVTSLPNAVAAVYLAARGRGAAALSTALNSNTINIVAGLLVPAVVVGLGRPEGQTTLVAGWCGGLTALTLVLAFAGRGLRRRTGAVVIGGYLLFVAVLLVT